MGIKTRLIVMNFLQFFIWGSWLITIGNYWFQTKQWSGSEFGIIFSTMGIASLFMPALMGIIADRWVSAQKLYGILHIAGAGALFFIPQINNPSTFFWGILVAMICYMPTIALTNSIAYTALKNNNYDIIKSFPPIRVFGTIGFIVAMWIVNLTGNKSSENQFYIASITSLLIGLYAFTLPKCPPLAQNSEKKSLVQVLGLEAFGLFKNSKMAMFFIFSMFLGAALQLTNAYGDVFLDDFKNIPQYADSFVVRYSTIIMSISQMSETLFILAIPFFLRRFGIKKVMLISMIAWVLRFGLFGLGNPADGLWMIILSCIIYGMAFDFFNISGSLFVETTTDSSMRSSAQGLFMMMTNGVGAILGSSVSGFLIENYFTLKFQDLNQLAYHYHTSISKEWIQKVIFDNYHKKVTLENVQSLIFDNKLIDLTHLANPICIKDWASIWLVFATYAAIVAVLFAIFFKHKHDPKALENFTH